MIDMWKGRTQEAAGAAPGKGDELKKAEEQLARALAESRALLSSLTDLRAELNNQRAINNFNLAYMAAHHGGKLTIPWDTIELIRESSGRWEVSLGESEEGVEIRLMAEATPEQLTCQ